MIYLAVVVICFAGLGTAETIFPDAIDINISTTESVIDEASNVTSGSKESTHKERENINLYPKKNATTDTLKERVVNTNPALHINEPDTSVRNETTTPASIVDSITQGRDVSNTTVGDFSKKSKKRNNVSTGDTVLESNGCEIWKYGGFPLVGLGIIFNGLSILVFSRKSIRKSTTTVMLTTLAFVDSFNLLNVALAFSLNCAFGISSMLTEQNYWTCKIGIVVLYVMTDLSPWLVALLAIERCIAVTIPHRVSLIMSPAKVKLAVGVTVLILIAANIQLGFIHVFDASSPDQFYCTPSQEYMIYYKEVFVWMDLALLSVIPLSIVIVCNIIILINVIRHHRSRKGMVAMYRTKNSVNSLTLMLVGVSFVLCICTLPHVIFYIFARPLIYNAETDDDTLAFIYKSEFYVTYVLYMNYAVNFWFYVFAGKHFRREVLKMVRCFNASSTEIKTSSTQLATVSNAISETALPNVNTKCEC
ncbi:unnamed protein product [Owenia fusiformis]|uniref:G-protein coupled receptors family 1 profile domain-containing protein n=1 Tax=Owenia fusiformis TaxID=6347 RepID=A0A8S4NKW0_OWEFU|nr:unnamed protein product [Owenia fusiformis]